jgi:nicotinamide phosphoribosyltransferase
MHNIILNTDSYKASHHLQYPLNTEFMSYYVESRGGKYDNIVFFGLQMFLKEYLTKPITNDMLNEAEDILISHGLPCNHAGWEYIIQTHGGFLPISIEAIPEGMITHSGQVMMQIVNTDPQCFWLPGYIETMLLRAAWYGTTVATVSRACKQVIARYLVETADDLSGLDYKLHDFGARGVSSQESSAIAGLAHLVSFKTTDTLSAIIAAKRYYGASDMPAFSIPAAEHSTITSWGRDREKDAYKHILQQFLQPGKAVAIVIDSYDLWQALNDLGTTFKDTVKNSGGTLIVRLDSGNPVDVVLQSLARLDHYFGSSINNKGYRVLPSYIRVIQSEGVSLNSIESILQHMKEHGYSAENIYFGMGSELLQRVNRDTLQFVMKASSVKVNGVWQDIYKSPVTDTNKQSKRGRLALILNDQGDLETIHRDQLGTRTNQLRQVFHNGELLIDESLKEIRLRSICASDTKRKFVIEV